MAGTEAREGAAMTRPHPHHRESDPAAVFAFALLSMLALVALFAYVAVQWWLP